MHELRMAAGVERDKRCPPSRDLGCGTAPCDQEFGDLIPAERRNWQRAVGWQGERERQSLRQHDSRGDHQMTAPIAQDRLDLRQRRLQRPRIRRQIDIIQHHMREAAFRGQFCDDTIEHACERGRMDAAQIDPAPA